MRTTAIIGFTDKGFIGSPQNVEDVQDLHISFGKKSNVVTVAEQLLYSDHKPIIFRLPENNQLATGVFKDIYGDVCMSINADSPGAIGNLTTVEVTKNGEAFDLLVFNSGEMVEFWRNLKPDQAMEAINFSSKWICVKQIKDTLPESSVINLSTRQQYKKPIIKSENVILALRALEEYDLEFVIIPDCQSHKVINSVLEYLELESPNTILIIDPPWEDDLLQTYQWCKSLHPSNCGVIFWPWLNYEGKNVPPSGAVIAAVLNWPFPWRATQKKLAGISGTMLMAYQDELVFLSRQEHFINVLNRDSLVLDNNIMTLAGVKLTQRRLLNYIKSNIGKKGTSLLSLYESTSDKFRHNFIEFVEYIMKQVKEDQGIINYNLQINELCRNEEFEIALEILLKDSSEIVNICFKFTK